MKIKQIKSYSEKNDIIKFSEKMPKSVIKLQMPSTKVAEIYDLEYLEFDNSNGSLSLSSSPTSLSNHSSNYNQDLVCNTKSDLNRYNLNSNSNSSTPRSSISTSTSYHSESISCFGNDCDEQLTFQGTFFKDFLEINV